jgi:hypothetical protein
MGQIATVESTIKTTEEGVPVRDVNCDTGGGNTVSAELMLPPGVDAAPLPGDSVFIEDGPGEGRKIATAFLDPENESKASDGEHRVYSRDPSTLQLVAEIWAKGDGSIVIEVVKAGGAPITIKTDGVVHVDSPDVRLGAGGQPVACVGDIVQGSVWVQSTAAGSPALPGVPSPATAIPFAGQITSGRSGVKA